MHLGIRVDHKESLENEFKEFCIKVNLQDYFSDEEMSHIVKSGEITSKFNSMVLDNLQSYFNSYVPKYSSAFSNSNIDNGKLHIGINDYGEVTGIPFLGNLCKNDIIGMIKQTESKYCTSPLDINIKIKKLKINTSLINDPVDEYIQMAKKKNDLYRMVNEAYYSQREKWIHEVLKYSVKLSAIIKNSETRSQFYKWVSNQSTISEQMLEKCHKESFAQIESTNQKRNFVTDPTSVIYWIAQFKDVRMRHLQSIKPECPMGFKQYNYNLYLITHLTDLRKRLISVNKQLNYYVIKIQYTNQKKTDIMYQKPYRHHKYYSYRLMQNTGPYCITHRE